MKIQSKQKLQAITKPKRAISIFNVTRNILILVTLLRLSGLRHLLQQKIPYFTQQQLRAESANLGRLLGRSRLNYFHAQFLYSPSLPATP
jgi:hypothetical protein